MSKYWGVGIVGSLETNFNGRNIGLSDYWVVGILGCRNIGLLEYWTVGILGAPRCAYRDITSVDPTNDTGNYTLLTLGSLCTGHSIL